MRGRWRQERTTMEENIEDVTDEMTDADVDDDPELLARKSSGGPATGNGDA